ncbi:unnamed protein product [Rotaria magnacalcarata]|uniref:Autophagy-related protein 16 domain-containing protein n=1 Tax=Rotaria magnacalcarata TaxID=392030 RepID=A0A819F6I6_9BILA|nr:unnamed protein product [Rotaria magnacalcarata]CAF3859628.1 unnamed protein product [Rotaria magnacalcarata]
MDWKSDIICQLKDQKQHWNVYDEIVEHYNRLLDSNTNLQIRCVKFENDVNHLRLANAGLEKASEASQAIANVNNKLTVANEEVVMHLREKGELAREVLRLNHALKESNEKSTDNEIKLQQYKNESEQLKKTVEKLESEVKELVEINEVLREEFSAVQNQFDQLQVDYNRIKPSFRELELELEKEKRTNVQRETELIECKKVQLEMLNAEVERFSRRTQQHRTSETADGGMGSISKDQHSSSTVCRNSNTASMMNSDTISSSSDDSSKREGRSTTSGSMSGGGSLLGSIRRIFAPGAINVTNDRLYRTSACYVSSSVPTHEVHHWDCTELEVYTLLFQPSGSILATGCSDKMVHLWDVSSAGQPYKYGSLGGSLGAINALDFDNEGARLLAGCSSDTAYIWSYGDNRVLKHTFTGHSGIIRTCKFISGTKLATGSADRLIKIWDLQSQQCTRNLFVGSKCHDLVVIDAIGTMISGHYDKKIHIWDAYTDKCRTELQCNAAITSLYYNAEKHQLLACLRDDTLKLIDLRQNNVLYTFNHDDFKVSTDTNKAVLSPDGRYACVGSQDGTIFIFNTTNGMCETELSKKHTTMVTSVAWHPEGRFVASCEKHRRVVLWSD